MGGVDAGRALHLVRRAAVLVARLEQLAPHLVGSLVVLPQLLPVLILHLPRHAVELWPSSKQACCCVS